VADNEPDRYATRREFSGPPENGASQPLSRPPQREGHRREDGDFDPRRTHREYPPGEAPVSDPRGTRREEGDPRRTYREEAGSPVLGPDSGDYADDETIVGLPRALRSKYSVLRELPNPGAEADVLLVMDAGASRTAVTDADLKVVKVYRRNIHADQAVWAKIQALSSDNIVRFIETGTSGGRDYEVMEYLPGGNLTQLAPGRAQSLATVAEVIRQIADGLAELHRLGIVHRDLKPENVLIRRRDWPVDVVVTDFGLSRAPEQSVVAASRSGTVAYLSPETLLHKGAQSSKARDWWALGMIARELLTGVRPFGEMGDEAIHHAVMLRSVDLGDIADPRARLLCRGLLLRDPHDRWGEAQVREWLAGGTPPVAEEAAEADGIRPFTFQQVQYRDRKALARAFARSWDEAARRYFVAMGTAAAASSSWRELQAWLEQFREAEGQDPEGLNAMIDNQLLPSSIPPDVKLLTLIQWLDPGLPPVYRGQPLDQQNLAAMAEHAAVDHEPAAGFTRIVGDLHQHDLLLQLARMRDGAGLAGVHATWRELDARFRQRAHALAPALPEDARQVTADADDSRRQAALLFLAADPQPLADTLQQHVARQAALLPAPVPWFDQIRTQAQDRPDPVDGALLLTLFPLAARYSAKADQDMRKREEIARNNEATWTEHERQRLEGDPGLPRALSYSGIAAAAMLVMFIVSVTITRVTGSEVLLELASGLVGVIVAGGVFITEITLAREMGSDYTYYRPTSGWGRGMQRAGSHIHGTGRGCLLIVVLIFVVPVALSAAFTVPAVVYIIFGFVHMLSWSRRRKQWLLRHEQEHRQIIGLTA
jgi:hypothetical protein